jgi:hypothetical protein
VLADREKNGRDDSDFYGLVWFGDGKYGEVEYATTRFGGGGWCRVDATPEVLAEVEAWCEGHRVRKCVYIGRCKSRKSSCQNRSRSSSCSCCLYWVRTCCICVLLECRCHFFNISKASSVTTLGTSRVKCSGNSTCNEAYYRNNDEYFYKCKTCVRTF